MRRLTRLASAIVVGGLFVPAAGSAALVPTAVDEIGDAKAREIVLTDIGNEPDDQMSLVRHLMYSNEIDLEGIVATTSTWKHALDAGSTDGVNKVLDAYAQVQPNLVKHDRDYPTPEHIRSLFFLGQPGYGKTELPDDKPLSPGARAIIAAVDRPDPRPLWITIAGGANTLAKALEYVRKTRSAAEAAAFVSKLRVYSISDQDDTGLLMRTEFADLLWVVSPTDQTAFDYGQATWTGISGEHWYRHTTVAQGPDPTTVTHAWLAAHIQSKGPMGAAYPTYQFIMEGDTPSWLWLVRNGLAGDRNPTWGGWGGRYIYRLPEGGPTTETRPIFTDDPDTVTGFDGQEHSDDFATIYRWRQAYQWDFSNRMDWTTKSYDEANHAPEVVVNGVGGTAPLYITAKPGTSVTLDAGGSTDPDKDQLTYTWMQYKEAGRTERSASPAVELSATSGDKIRVTPKGVGQAHIILTVMDNRGSTVGEPFPGRSYRRIVVNFTETEPVPAEPVPAKPVPAKPVPAAVGPAACGAPRLSLAPVSRKARRRVRKGRTIRYRVRLTCSTGSYRRPATKGTLVYVQWVNRRKCKRASRPVALDTRGVAVVRIRLARSGVIRAIHYDKASGKPTTARFRVRIASDKTLRRGPSSSTAGAGA